MSRSGSLILCYHRVGEGNEDPFQLCVTPANFAAHLEEITRYGVPSTLSELGLPSRRPRVVVTFDDGYADNLNGALPVAEAKGIPITVFVTSGVVGGQQGFWWDRLGTLLRSRPPAIREISVPTTEGSVRVRLGSSKAGKDLQAVRHHLMALGVPEIHRFLDAVSEQWGVIASSPPDARPLTPSELSELAASDAATIGAHTTDHVRLRGLPESEQATTIAGSKEQLEHLSGREVAHFAYPYGGPDSFDEHSVEAARAAGFETACTTIPGNARSTTDPHLLPRRLVMNWSGLRFKAELERWRLISRH